MLPLALLLTTLILLMMAIALLHFRKPKHGVVPKVKSKAKSVKKASIFKRSAKPKHAKLGHRHSPAVKVKRSKGKSPSLEEVEHSIEKLEELMKEVRK